MYELTCPTCKHVAKLPFVRLGASTPCAQCGTRFTIAEEHVRRPPPPPGHAAPTVRPMPIAEPPEQRGPDDSGQVIGLSGLSEMLRRENHERESPILALRANPAEVAAAARRGRASRPRPGVLRSTRMMILLLLGVVTVLAFSGVLVWYNARQHADTPALPQVAPP